MCACSSVSRACVGSTLVTLLHVTACLSPPSCTHFYGAQKYRLILPGPSIKTCPMTALL